MDPFEEFEFKPLTDGLGFHKKQATPAAKEELKADIFSTKPVKDQGLELIDEPSTNQLRPPLPRKARANSNIPDVPDSMKDSGTGEGSAAVDEILKTLQKNRKFDFDNSKQKISTTAAKEEYKKTSWSFSAAVLDAMLVVAAGLLCMIVLLVITKVDLIGNLSNPDSQGMIYLATFAMFGGVSFIYLVLNRIFVGCTPGEWAFDQRVGKPEELNNGMFSLKVVARSLLVIATGFVILPILSALMGQDIAGNATGARLYKKV